MKISVNAYPEWGRHFEYHRKRCDRCWFHGETMRRDGRKWLCDLCDERYYTSIFVGIVSRTHLRIKRILWNLAHDEKIPNNPGHP